MKFLFLSICLILPSCATHLYSPTSGKKLASFYSNMTNVKYKGGGVEFSADKIDNSGPTRAAGSVIGTALAGTTSLAGALFTGMH